jgi:hypothetical protein
MRLLRSSPIRALAHLFSGTVLAAVLAGCGGSLDGHDYDLTTETRSTLSGTVAVGAPMLDATISVKDANGVVASAPVARDGSYRLSLAGLTAPFSLQACGFVAGNHGCYDGVIDEGGVGNVAPLTTCGGAPGRF